ncbi:MAG: peptidylprolyl isomerase [Bacteroidales bacterium]
MAWTDLRLLVAASLFFLGAGCSADKTEVVLDTELGEIRVELYPKQAPATTANFLTLVKEGVYDDALFYRVVRPDNQAGSPVKIQVVQGGLYQDSLIDLYPGIVHEHSGITGIRHLDGTFSMARNEPGTASTEFFICIDDQPSLDFGGKRNPDGQGFAAFGKVTRGMELVRDIQQMQDTGQYLVAPVRIRAIRPAK